MVSLPALLLYTSVIKVQNVLFEQLLYKIK